MFGRHSNRTLYPFGYKRPFRHVHRLLKRADLTMGNLETPITAKRYFWMTNSVLVFRAKPKAAKILQTAGFDLMITANNHARDQKARGLLETIQHLKKAGLRWVGTGASRKAAFRPYIFKKNGLSVGVLAVCTIKNYSRGQRKGYFAHIPRKKLRRRMARRVRRLKKKVDFVVVHLHYGDEYRTTPTWGERRIAHTLVKAGADVIFGHHPHVLRGIQRIGRAVVFYSLGNFLFDMNWKRTDESGVAHVVLEKKGPITRVSHASLSPVIIGSGFLPRPARGAVARRIIKRVKTYSRRFRKTTRFCVRSGRLEVKMRPRPPSDS